MSVVTYLAAIIAFLFMKGWLVHLWDEWKGAFRRWKDGQPLRHSEALRLRVDEARQKVAEERRKMRSAYERQPSRILNRAFRDRFIDLGIAEEIRAQVKRTHGMVCACCSARIRLPKNRHIDHLKPMKLYPELEFFYTNLQVLCRTCNVHKSAYDGADWKEVVAARRKQTVKTKRMRKARQVA
jgi:5-methylcytosine-specific restriction endonuclease McrA